MNSVRVAVLLRELAAALEEPEKPRKRRPRVANDARPVDELAQADARRILRRKGIIR